MEVRVHYATEIGSQITTMEISELLAFTKRFKVLSIQEIPQDTTEHSLDELLDKHAKQHMIDWDLERFKISHRRLYATFKAVFNEATTNNAKDFEIEALKRQIKVLEHEKTNSPK
jgi:hypothetical protein